MSNQNERVFVELLQQIKEVLDNFDIDFWLDCGTLLGLLRDGKFIPWVRDIDLASWDKFGSENMKTCIADELSNRGFRVCVSEDYITVGKDNCYADIFFYSLVNEEAVKTLYIPKGLLGKFLNIVIRVLSAPYYYDIAFSWKPLKLIRSTLSIIGRIVPCFIRKKIVKYLRGFYKGKSARKIWRVVPSHYFLNLKAMRFYEMEFKIPSEAEEYLIYRYGKDWRIPKSDWITERDSGAVTKSLP